MQWLLSRQALQPLSQQRGARRTVGRALQMAAELFQLLPALEQWAGGGKATSQRPAEGSRTILLSKERFSLRCLYFYPNLTACRLNITVFNLPKILRSQVFPRQLKDRDAAALKCDSKLLLQEENLLLKMLFSPRLCSPKKLLWSRYLKRFIHSSSCPWHPYPPPPFPKPPSNCAEWLSGAEGQPSAYTPCQTQALSLKQATFAHWLPSNSSFRSEPYSKKLRSPLLWMPSFPRSHVSYFLLPLSSVTQQICIATGSGFVSQNFVCKSFLYLEGS